MIPRVRRAEGEWGELVFHVYLKQHISGWAERAGGRRKRRKLSFLKMEKGRHTWIDETARIQLCHPKVMINSSFHENQILLMSRVQIRKSTCPHHATFAFSCSSWFTLASAFDSNLWYLHTRDFWFVGTRARALGWCCVRVIVSKWTWRNAEQFEKINILP